MRLGRDVLGLDLYQMLGVGRTATSREIRRAYLRQVRASHPDLNREDETAGERMARINVAARVLLDPALRRLYDRSRSSQRPGAPAWYERRPEGRETDWSRAPRPARVRPQNASARAFLAELRGLSARASLRIDEALLSVPRGTQRTATLVLIAAALWLIAAAHPKNLWAGESAEPRPTSVSPFVLNP
jgi:curved DNA-binding protein CbpA